MDYWITATSCLIPPFTHQVLHWLVLVREGRLVRGDAAVRPVCHNEAPRVLHPDVLERLVARDTLALLHRHGDQLRDADGSLASAWDQGTKKKLAWHTKDMRRSWPTGF